MRYKYFNYLLVFQTKNKRKEKKKELLARTIRNFMYVKICFNMIYMFEEKIIYGKRGFQRTIREGTGLVKTPAFEIKV
jgi:hypothetical protein